MKQTQIESIVDKFQLNRTWIIRYVNNTKLSFNLVVFQCFCFAAIRVVNSKPLPTNRRQSISRYIPSKTIEKCVYEFQMEFESIWTHTLIEVFNIKHSTMKCGYIIRGLFMYVRNSIHTLINIQSECFSLSTSICFPFFFSGTSKLNAWIQKVGRRMCVCVFALLVIVNTNAICYDVFKLNEMTVLKASI